MSTVSILLVEDDPSVRFGLEEVLRRDGYAVDAVDSGNCAIELINGRNYDLVLLDLMLRDMNGLDVLAALKKQSPSTVAVILTAYASTDSAVEALRHGAHDYLFKPCKTKTLRESIRSGLARRQELIRQEGATQTLKNIQQLLKTGQNLDNTTSGPPPKKETPPTAESRSLKHNDLIVDRDRYIVTFKNKPLQLSPTEYQILTLLIQESPRVVTPKEIAAGVLEYEVDNDEARKLISYHIYRMRRKFREINPDREPIKTVRGVGYALT